MRISDWSSDVCSSDLDLVVELLAALVEAAGAVGQHLFEDRVGDRAAALPFNLLASKLGGDLQQGQPAAHITVGGRCDQPQLLVADGQAAIAEPAFGVFQRAAQRGEDVVGGHRPTGRAQGRNEEHTSELPSLMRISYA